MNPIYDALREGKLVLSVEIEDYAAMNCVKKFSDFFDINQTVGDVIVQIAKKKSVFLDLTEGKDRQFQLFFVDKKEKKMQLDKEKPLSFYGLAHRDVVMLKQTTVS